MRHESFNCASGISVSIGELADFVLAETGSTWGIEYAPARRGDIQHFAVDNTKLRRLGIDFDTDWRSIVRKVIASQDSDGVANGRAVHLAGAQSG